MIFKTPELAWACELEMINSLSFSVSGALAVASTDQTEQKIFVRIWEVDFGLLKEEASPDKFVALKHELQEGHTKTVNSISFSPKDELLVTGGDDCLVVLWH